MNTLKLTFSLFILLLIVSCATPQSSPTESDHIMAEEFAKKDAMNYSCFGYHIHRRMGFADHKARKYTKLLQDQGRSEAFIKGFYRGYENYYHEFLDLYCT
jgi:hypothetical protein